MGNYDNFISERGSKGFTFSLLCEKEVSYLLNQLYKDIIKHPRMLNNCLGTIQVLAYQLKVTEIQVFDTVLKISIEYRGMPHEINVKEFYTHL